MGATAEQLDVVVVSRVLYVPNCSYAVISDIQYLLQGYNLADAQFHGHD